MPTTVKISSNQIQVDVTGATGDPRDFVALYRPGAPDLSFLDWKYLANNRQNRLSPGTKGVTEGSVDFTITDPTSEYEVRVLTASGTSTYAVIPGTSVKVSYANINVGIPVPPPALPVPTAITLTPPSISIPLSYSIDTFVSKAFVTMSNGSVFIGSFALSPIPSILNIAANGNLTLNRVLTSTDVGTKDITIVATQNNTSISATLRLTIASPVLSLPTSLSLSPSTISLVETSLLDTVVSTPTTITNDNTAFAGVYTFDNTVLAMKDGKIVLARNLATRDIGTTSIKVTATQNNVLVSASLGLTITATAPPPPPPTDAGYVATLQMGSPPTGTIYTFSPILSKTGQTALNRGDFVSDFAGFTQNSIEVSRTDTPFHIHFRQDVAPDPKRFECVISLGHPTIDHTAANAGPFTFTLYKDSTLVYSMTAPSMGWHTRRRCWTHDGVKFYSDPSLDLPRPEIRDRTKLGPKDLNFLPNFSQAVATKLRCAASGSQGGFRNQTSYSGTNNPFGWNENCGLASYTGGVGDRADIGILTDWQAEYVITGALPAKKTMYIHAEVAGGMPWNLRDNATGSPINLITTNNPYFGGSEGGYDLPNVYVPSTGDVWSLETNHLPCLSYLPYILTGDPFYLENLQFQANWTVGTNNFHRSNGYLLNYSDPTSPVADNNGNIPLFTGWRLATRGLGWTIRDFGMFYRATPSVVPSWLLPKSYAKDVLDKNRAWAEKNSLNNAYVKANYPGLDNFGVAPAAVDFEEGFFVSYGLMGIGFVINQAGLPDWKPFYEYFCRLPVGLAVGGNGWPQNWPSPYTLAIQAFSTDYDISPAPILTFDDMWKYNNNNTAHSVGAWGNGGSPTYRSMFPSRRPNAPIVCNSWIIEVRTGIPTLPNLGDKIDFTITGAFTPTPISVSHTVTAADIAYLNTLNVNTPSTPNTTIMDDLVSKLNAALPISIRAGNTNTAPTIGVWFTKPVPGRVFISFDSTKVGDINITGRYTSVGPKIYSSIYVQPNGDGMWYGNAGPNLYKRTLNYQAASTGTTSSLDTFDPTRPDGTVKWYLVPENKSVPFIVPWLNPPLPPILLQMFAPLENGSPQPHYAVQALAGLNMAIGSGVPNATIAAANIKATVEDWFTNQDPTVRNRFSFCIDQ